MKTNGMILYKYNEFVCRSEKSEYLLDETPQIIMENRGENTLVFRITYYQLDYLYEGKWYAVHIGYYPYLAGVELMDNRIAGGEEHSYGLSMNYLDEWRRVEKPEVNEDGTMDIMDDQLELRPGRYRFSRRAKIEETGEVITLACEYDIVEAKE